MVVVSVSAICLPPPGVDLSPTVHRGEANRPIRQQQQQQQGGLMNGLCDWPPDRQRDSRTGDRDGDTQAY